MKFALLTVINIRVYTYEVQHNLKWNLRTGSGGRPLVEKQWLIGMRYLRQCNKT
jgi:hypothetical protein